MNLRTLSGLAVLLLVSAPAFAQGTDGLAQKLDPTIARGTAGQARRARSPEPSTRRSPGYTGWTAGVLSPR